MPELGRPLIDGPKLANKFFLFRGQDHARIKTTLGSSMGGLNSGVLRCTLISLLFGLFPENGIINVNTASSVYPNL